MIIKKIKNIIKRIVPATYRKIDESDKKLQKQIKALQAQIKEYQKPILDFICYSEIMHEAKRVHETTYPKYRNFLKGKDVAIIGSGPSLDCFNSIDDCVQIGVNSTIFSEKTKLDYLFFQDYNLNYIHELKKIIEKRKNNNLKVFVGMHYYKHITPVPLYEIEALNAEQYFFHGRFQDDYYPWSFTLDISEKPFVFCVSTIFIALQFALYTHPKRIFVVGCDCSSDHYSGNILNIPISDRILEYLLKYWVKFKDFANRFYPDIEIISINPVGLKGLFHDVYTEEYLIEHPEIDQNKVEIYR